MQLLGFVIWMKREEKEDVEESKRSANGDAPTIINGLVNENH